jgi:hypothetical protein
MTRVCFEFCYITYQLLDFTYIFFSLNNKKLVFNLYLPFHLDYSKIIKYSDRKILTEILIFKN